MSRGLGKLERLILDYLGGVDEDYGRICPKGEQQALWIANCLNLPRDEWYERHHRSYGIKPTRAWVVAVLRAVKSLERKGLVTTVREHNGKSFDDRGPHHGLMVRLCVDHLEGCLISQHLQIQSHGAE